MTISRNDDDSNADDSIRVKDDGLSNETDSQKPQEAKHFEQRTSTLPGISIERNEEDSNAEDSIDFNDDPLSKKLTPEIGKMPNNANRESHILMESRDAEHQQKSARIAFSNDQREQGHQENNIYSLAEGKWKDM
jgi:hypothetical protein